MKKGLLSLLIGAFIFVGCSNETKEEVKEVTNKSIDKAAEISQETTKKTKEVVETVQKETEPMIEKAVQKSKEISEEVSEKTAEVVKSVVEKTKEMSSDVQKKIHEATAPKIDGKALYARCASCHGANGEKKALNASQVIQGWEKEKVLETLNGYKNGTYGGAMKSIMQGQVSKLSEEELQAISAYISSL